MEDERYPFEFEGNYEILAKILSENDPLKGMRVSKGVSRWTPHYREEKLRKLNPNVPILRSELDEYMIDNPDKDVVLCRVDITKNADYCSLYMCRRYVTEDGNVIYPTSFAMDMRILRNDVDNKMSRMDISTDDNLEARIDLGSLFEVKEREHVLLLCDPIISHHIYKKRYPNDTGYQKYLSMLNLDNSTKDMKDYPIFLSMYLSWSVFSYDNRKMPNFSMSVDMTQEKDVIEYETFLRRAMLSTDNVYRIIRSIISEL